MRDLSRMSFHSIFAVFLCASATSVFSTALIPGGWPSSDRRAVLRTMSREVRRERDSSMEPIERRGSREMLLRGESLSLASDVRNSSEGAPHP